MRDMSESLHLYVHIPFCLKKCRYCSFVSRSDASLEIDDYAALVVREMAKRAATAPLPPSPAATLYLGGGTPSLLSPAALERIIGAAVRYCGLATDAEVTLEANPGTVTFRRLADFRSTGVNRLSLGIQSFDDGMLSLLGRLHTARQAREAVTAARRAGFDNVGIDLIHSLPGQTPDRWCEQLACAVALHPDHVSAYGLTVEEGTPFAAMEERGELVLPDEEQSALMFETTADVLVSAGFEHYEIANFALPHRRSCHNQAYWLRRNYLGFGAGAYSFLRVPDYGVRWKNADDLERYRDTLAAAELPREDQTVLSRADAMAEFFFLGLRLLDGVREEDFVREFGDTVENVYGHQVERLCAAGLLKREGSRLKLTRRGTILSNRVFASFL